MPNLENFGKKEISNEEMKYFHKLESILSLPNVNPMLHTELMHSPKCSNGRVRRDRTVDDLSAGFSANLNDG